MGEGITFVISAPSGVGKSTLVKELVARDRLLGFCVSHTTRMPRAGEVDGVDYHFVDRETFEAMVARSGFAEWAEVHANLYGTSFQALERQTAGGRDVILDIDVQGALQIADRMKEAVLVFILPPSWGELRRRIESRRLDSPQSIARRLEAAREEVVHAGRYHYLVVNEDLGRAVDDLGAIVRAERCRLFRNRDRLAKLVGSSPADPTFEPLSVNEE